MTRSLDIGINNKHTQPTLVILIGHLLLSGVWVSRGYKNGQLLTTYSLTINIIIIIMGGANMTIKFSKKKVCFGNEENIYIRVESFEEIGYDLDLDLLTICYKSFVCTQREVD